MLVSYILPACTQQAILKHHPNSGCTEPCSMPPHTGTEASFSHYHWLFTVFPTLILGVCVFKRMHEEGMYEQKQALHGAKQSPLGDRSHSWVVHSEILHVDRVWLKDMHLDSRWPSRPTSVLFMVRMTLPSSLSKTFQWYATLIPLIPENQHSI